VYNVLHLVPACQAAWHAGTQCSTQCTHCCTVGSQLRWLGSQPLVAWHAASLAGSLPGCSRPDMYTCLAVIGCLLQKNIGACNQSFMKDNNYCLYTCGRCPSSPAPPSSPSQGGGSPAPPSSPSQGGGSPAPPSSPSSEGFAKPGDPNVCDDIAPNGQYTCAQQVSNVLATCLHRMQLACIGCWQAAR